MSQGSRPEPQQNGPLSMVVAVCSVAFEGEGHVIVWPVCRGAAGGVRHGRHRRGAGNGQPGHHQRPGARPAGRGCARRAGQLPARRTPTSPSKPPPMPTDAFAFRICGSARTSCRVRLQGFKEHARSLVLSAGSAFDLSITPRRRRHRRRRHGRRRQLRRWKPRAARSSARCRRRRSRTCPMNGRNFLDLALLVPGVSPTNTNSTQLFAETSAVPGQGLSIASQRNLSNSFIVDGLSANDDAAGLSGIPFGVDAIEQFQVVTGGGQAELGRALGGYVNVVTRSGTNALHGTGYGFFRDDAFNGKNALTGHHAADGPAAVRRQPRRSAGAEPHLLLHQRRAQAARPDRRREHHGRERRRDQRPAGTGRLSGPAGRDGHLSQSRAQPERARQGRPSDQRRRSAQRALCALRRDLEQRARRRHPERAVGLDRAWTTSTSRLRSATSGRCPRTPSTRPGSRSRTATWRRSPPISLVRRSRSPASRRSARSRAARPAARTRMFQVVNNLSHRAGAHALRAGVDFLYNDDTITFLRTFRGSYTFSSMANFLTSTYSGFAQTFGNPVVNQTNPNFGIYAQDEWRAGSRLTLNLGLRYDLQFLETINTDTNNVSPRARLRLGADRVPGLRRPRRRRRVLRSRAAARRRQRAAVGGQHHRCHATAPAAGVRHPAVTGRRAGLPEHPARPPALDDPRLDHDDGQGPAERLLEAGQHRGRAGARRQPCAHGRLPVLPRREPADVDQPERADLRGRRHQQRLPAGARRT